MAAKFPGNNLSGLSAAKLDRSLRDARASQARHHALSQVQPDFTVSTCVIRVNDTGEVVASFPFACAYSEVPSITYSFQIQSVTRGKAPLISASVLEWQTVDRYPSSRLFVGADLLIVSENVPDVSFVVVAEAKGMAIAGPR